MTNIHIPPIFKSLSEGARYFVYYGGRGSGKSHSIARYLICCALAQKLKILCTRELQNSIAESVYVLLKNIIIQYDLYPYFYIKVNSIECVNGSMFIFKGLAHNIESVKSTEGVDICWIEEADKVHQNSWDILIPTIRKPNSKFIVTFNPTHDDDPVYKMFITKQHERTITQKVNWSDNPYFPDVLRQEMEAMRESDYDRYLHVWEGELRTISDAQVFKNKYCVQDFETPKDITFYHGMDFGFAKDPTTVIRAFIRGKSLFIDREEYGHHVEIKDIPAMVRNIMVGTDYYLWQIKADAARPETISYLKNMGINCVAASKWSGSIEDGIEYMKSFQQIVIHPRCKNTIEEFRRYSYKIDKRTNDILPIVLDDFNHCIARGELVTTDKGDIPIEQIKIGDWVRTRMGFNKVLFSGVTDRDRQVISIKTTCGKIVRCTPDHRIWTEEKGFVRADSLRYGDKILTIKDEGKKCSTLVRLWNIMARFIIDIRTQKEELIGYISRESQSICTERFGKKQTEKYQKAFMFIILMAIQLITHLKILVSYQPKNTWQNIPLKICKDKKNTLKKSGRYLKRGMDHLRDLRNTEKLGQWLIKILCLPQRFVGYAVKNFYQKQSAIEIFNAQTIANQNGEDCKGLIKSLKIVQIAENHLRQTSISQQRVVQSRVLEVCDDQETSNLVYDLTVENNHEFFVNGVLVHNCIDAIRYSLSDLIKRKATIYDDGVL